MWDFPYADCFRSLIVGSACTRPEPGDGRQRAEPKGKESEKPKRGVKDREGAGPLEEKIRKQLEKGKL